MLLLAATAAAAALAVTAKDAPELGFWPVYGGSRRVVKLDGVWKYGLHTGPFDSMAPGFDPTPPSLTPSTASVPSCMDTAPPGIMGARGVAIYRTSFKQSAGPARIHFGACGFYCRVFVDGAEIGDHRAGGYVPFHLDVPAVGAAADRELVVLADNRFNKTTAPTHTGGDFWNYGGIMRSVLLHDMPAEGVWPWRVYALPTKTGYTQGEVDVQVVLTNPTYSGPVSVSVSFDGGAAGKVSGAAAAGQMNVTLKVPSPTLWSQSEPNLHTITVTTDDGAAVTERFGLRWWGVDAATSRLTLNGKITKLTGWNHHTQWPDTGASPTDAQMDSDLAQMRAAGTTYIRGAHYPQDPRWLDRLDEAGVAMWEETIGPGTTKEDLTDWDFFMKYQLQQLDEMLDGSLNHASIMTWGWFNEGPSDSEAACPAYKACADRARARDPTRFQTWADNKEILSLCLKHASLIAFNSYPAWYQKAGDFDYIAQHWNEMADTVRLRYPGKPFVISETGAGGIYEWADNATAKKWTQPYQVEVIKRDVAVALSNDNISGITLWHYFDFKGNDGATKQCHQCDYLPGVSPPTCGYIKVNCSRPGGENHKGVVDFWRREKKAYSVVQAQYKNVTSGL